MAGTQVVDQVAGAQVQNKVAGVEVVDQVAGAQVVDQVAGVKVVDQVAGVQVVDKMGEFRWWIKWKSSGAVSSGGVQIVLNQVTGTPEGGGSSGGSSDGGSIIIDPLNSVIQCPVTYIRMIGFMCRLANSAT